MRLLIQKTIKRLRREYYKDRSRFALRVTVIILATALLLGKRSIWTPDTLLLIVLIVGVVFGRTRDFIVRFVPFLGLLVAYDSMRGWADDLSGTVNYWPMIHWDEWFGNGRLPTITLQSWWWDGTLKWYDFYFYFLYTIHFLVPVIMGLLLWRYRPKLYWPFVWTLVGASFIAFIIYVIFPAAPPWLAHEQGYISENLHRVSSDVWWAMGVQNFSEVYKNISPNAVAAVPSLHSAYPLIATLFVGLAFGFRKSWFIWLYPLSMWVGVVYLGEHYVFDIVAAIILVGVVMSAVLYGFKKYRIAHPEIWWRRLLSRVNTVV